MNTGKNGQPRPHRLKTSWKRAKPTTMSSSESFILARGEHELARVQQLKGTDLYFWYTLSGVYSIPTMNTSSSPTTLGQAKKDASAHVRAHIKKTLR